MPDLSKLAFWSGANYMKRKKLELRYKDVSIGAYGTATFTVNHGVAHVPEYDIWADLMLDGYLWSGNIPEVGMGGFFTPAYASFESWITANVLTIQVSNPSGGTISVRVYYLVYKDYA